MIFNPSGDQLAEGLSERKNGVICRSPVPSRFSTNNATCASGSGVDEGPAAGLKRRKTKRVPSGDMSAGVSIPKSAEIAEYGLVVSRTGPPPSEARMLKTPELWSPSAPKPQSRRVWSRDHTKQFMSGGPYVIVRRV